MTKLCAIYNVFDGEEHLPYSMQCLKDHVDLFIIVYQDISNFGERYEPILKFYTPEDFCGVDWKKVLIVKFDPRVEMGGLMNERAKRNLGLDVAKQEKCTHFLNIDCDEYYPYFATDKEKFFNTGCKGSVCRLQTYFKKPTLMLDRPEDYYVPFIHELNEHTRLGSSGYPFWVDPTRTVSESNVIELPIFMHHYSWVRKDIDRKVRNSSAKENIDRMPFLKEYHSDLKAGSYLECLQRNLVEVDDQFGINHIFGF